MERDYATMNVYILSLYPCVYLRIFLKNINPGRELLGHMTILIYIPFSRNNPGETFNLSNEI